MFDYEEKYKKYKSKYLSLKGRGNNIIKDNFIMPVIYSEEWGRVYGLILRGNVICYELFRPENLSEYIKTDKNGNIWENFSITGQYICVKKRAVYVSKKSALHKNKIIMADNNMIKDAILVFVPYGYDNVVSLVNNGEFDQSAYDFKINYNKKACIEMISIFKNPVHKVNSTGATENKIYHYHDIMNENLDGENITLVNGQKIVNLNEGYSMYVDDFVCVNSIENYKLDLEFYVFQILEYYTFFYYKRGNNYNYSFKTPVVYHHGATLLICYNYTSYIKSCLHFDKSKEYQDVDKTGKYPALLSVYDAKNLNKNDFPEDADYYIDGTLQNTGIFMAEIMETLFNPKNEYYKLIEELSIVGVDLIINKKINRLTLVRELGKKIKNDYLKTVRASTAQAFEIDEKRLTKSVYTNTTKYNGDEHDEISFEQGDYDDGGKFCVQICIIMLYNLSIMNDNLPTKKTIERVIDEMNKYVIACADSEYESYEDMTDEEWELNYACLQKCLLSTSRIISRFVEQNKMYDSLYFFKLPRSFVDSFTDIKNFQ